jgi:hypothetical protein
MTDVIENVLQNINYNIPNKETSHHNDEPDNELYNNLLHQEQKKHFSSPIILSQQETIGLPELLIKHAIDNNNYTNTHNNNHNNEQLKNTHLPPNAILKYDIIMTSPQTPSRHNFGSNSPQEIIDKLLYSDMILSPHPQPETNQFQEAPIIESPHDKIENLLEQITSHKVESPHEQDAEKLFNINIFLEDLKTKKKTTKNKSNKTIQQNIIAIEKILKNIKTNIKKKNKKITCKNSKIKSDIKTTTKTIKPSTKTTNKKVTHKKDKIKNVTTNKKTKRIKKEETLFDNLLSNFT